MKWIKQHRSISQTLECQFIDKPIHIYLPLNLKDSGTWCNCRKYFETEETSNLIMFDEKIKNISFVGWLTADQVLYTL